ncbi:hypothetical protein Tco_0414257 [Tanacetum coccineum]
MSHSSPDLCFLLLRIIQKNPLGLSLFKATSKVFTTVHQSEDNIPKVCLVSLSCFSKSPILVINWNSTSCLGVRVVVGRLKVFKGCFIGFHVQVKVTCGRVRGDTVGIFSNSVGVHVEIVTGIVYVSDGIDSSDVALAIKQAKPFTGVGVFISKLYIL